MRFKQGCKPSPLNPKGGQAIISALGKAVAPSTSAPHCVTVCSCARGQQLSSYAKRTLLAGFQRFSFLRNRDAEQGNQAAARMVLQSELSPV